jgi:hypothetical protein
MAINFLNTVDFNKNQLDYAAIQNIGQTLQEQLWKDRYTSTRRYLP